MYCIDAKGVISNVDLSGNEEILFALNSRLVKIRNSLYVALLQWHPMEIYFM